MNDLAEIRDHIRSALDAKLVDANVVGVEFCDHLRRIDVSIEFAWGVAIGRPVRTPTPNGYSVATLTKEELDGVIDAIVAKATAARSLVVTDFNHQS